MLQVKYEATRIDRAGNKIEQKSHKISFRDKIDKTQRVCDVYLVESYKKYNASEDPEESIICKCNIF